MLLFSDLCGFLLGHLLLLLRRLVSVNAIQFIFVLHLLENVNVVLGSPGRHHLVLLEEGLRQAQR